MLLQHSEYSETKQNRTLPPNTRTANPSLNIARTTESALNWFCTNNGSSDEIWSSSKGNLKDNLVAQSSRIQTDPIIWARHTVTRRCMNIYLQHLHKSVADPRLASSFILLAVQPTFRCTVCPIPKYTGSTWGGCCCRAGGGTGRVFGWDEDCLWRYGFTVQAGILGEENTVSAGKKSDPASPSLPAEHGAGKWGTRGAQAALPVGPTIF